MDLLGGHSAWAWVGFNALVLGLLAIDLGVLNRRTHVIRFHEALVWNVIWILVALGFWGWVASTMGRQAGLEYLTGYVIERALSVDNIFVFVIVFGYFQVPAEFQRRILYWGILGALVMRGTLILAGAAVVAAFHWVLYLFGAFLIWSGIHLLWADGAAPHPEKNPLVRLATRFLPVSSTLNGARFFVRTAEGIKATPLLIVLLVVETTDLVFAFDSIPAIFGVTRDPFIIYSSNVFAILGLRAMYFLLSALLPHFRFLKPGLSLVLVLVGARMLLDRVFPIPTGATLLAVCGILGVAVLASWVFPKREPGPGVPG